MKRTNLILCILGTLSLYGCTLEAPLNLGEKCSDDEHALSAVVYGGMVCTRDDLDAENGSNCRSFADSFKYGYCPPEYFCIKDQDGTNICSVTSCLFTQHEHNGQCEENTLLHCGQHGYECELNTAGWVDGYCHNDISGAKCFANKCEEGYTLNSASGQCEALIECGPGEHIYMGFCESDSLENCGRHAYACANRTAGWINGACVEGICVPSECDSGYKLEKGTCKSLIDCGEMEHIFNGECEADGIANCGHHGNDCRLIEGWNDGNCIDARCFATSCIENYDLIKEIGSCRFHVAQCGDDEHIVNNTCEKNDVENCGMHDYACVTRMPGWVSGNCVGGLCEADTCEAGYVLGTNKQCEALMDCDPGEHIADGNCVEDTIEACGSSNNDCTKMAGWEAGDCIDQKCVASACATGYELNGIGQCVALTSCLDPDTYYHNGECVANDLNHCGSHEHSCTEVTGWEDGKCVRGKCVASACSVGYDLRDGKCEALTSCDDPNTHYYNGECIPNDLTNCGKHEYACENNITGWSTGNCVQGKCVASTCVTGYDVINGKCEAKTSCDDPETHYYNGECIANDINNCGKHNNKCSDITGWGNGACQAGVCVPSSCATGYHLNSGKTACVADDANNCGSVGKKCGQGEVCTSGDCKANCGSGEVRCEKGGVVSCADPNTSTTFCGANSTCSAYNTCLTGQACIGGQCVQTSCSGNSTLCSVNGVNQCIDLNSTNAAHCGACNLKCADMTVANAKSTTCSGGKCQYSCNSGYKNCGSATVPNCIPTSNLNTDPNNCGTCGKKCGSDEFCSAGVCKKSTCTNSCLSNNTCVNTSDKCGTQCVNCNTANHAAAGSCSSSGACSISSCAPGYHISSGTCVQNTPTACGSVSSTTTTNCKTSGNATDGYCDASGACVYTSCKTGYHIESGKCVSDSKTACGAAMVNCTTLPGWSDGTCTSGVCKASKCKTNYCLSNGTCVDGSANSNTCGIDGTACTSCGSNKSCVSGKCVQTSCAANTCFYQGTSCSNTAEHCGTNCVNCNITGNAAAGTCNAGTCNITKCAQGFHLKGSSPANYTCVANTDTACGAVNSTTVTNCWTANNAQFGYCTINGTCMPVTCKTGYHLYDNSVCLPNTDSGCGTKPDGWDFACDTTNHFVCNVEKAQCECAEGYKLDGDICVEDNLDGACDSSNYAVVAGGVKAYCIKSKTDLLNMKNNMNSSSHWPTDNEDDAYYLTRDIDLGTQSSWTTINGTYMKHFFGNGYTISGNLTCSGDCALFGALSGAAVDRLKLKLTVKGGKTAAALATIAFSSTLDNIYQIGGISSSGGAVGGIVASAGNCQTNSLKYLSVNGNMTTPNIAGGIIGTVTGPCNIYNSHYNGTVNGGGGAGGIVGSADAPVSIYNSYAEGSISGASNVGGIAGYLKYGAAYTIDSSWFNGTVKGNGYVGGIVGQCSTSNGPIVVKNSAVFGTLDGTSSTTASTVGGIIGYGWIQIDTSFSAADITNTKTGAMLGTLHGYESGVSITTAYSTGNFKSVATGSRDVLDNIPTPKMVLSWDGVSTSYTANYPNYIKYDSSFNPTYSSKALVTALNEAAGSSVWESRTCQISTGPANGSTKKVHLAVPKALGIIPFCTRD